jgi:hypothetical protein
MGLSLTAKYVQREGKKTLASSFWLTSKPKIVAERKNEQFW